MFFLLSIWLITIRSSKAVQTSTSISSHHWFDGNETLIWRQGNDQSISSDLSYGATFLSNKQYLWNPPYITYFDDRNGRVYMLNESTIIAYDLMTGLSNDIYRCESEKCSFFVDVSSLFVDRNDVLYAIHPTGYVSLNLNNLKEIHYDSWNAGYFHQDGPFVVHDNFLYFIGHGIGIAMKQINAPMASKILFRKHDITSFVMDTSREIIYFSTSNQIHYFEFGVHSILDLNVNITASSNIRSLEINTDGTMLFVAYIQKGNLYLLNWPTPFGCSYGSIVEGNSTAVAVLGVDDTCVPFAQLISSNADTSTQNIGLFYYNPRSFVRNVTEREFHVSILIRNILLGFKWSVVACWKIAAYYILKPLLSILFL